MSYVLGIDVGSGSARCGVFTSDAMLKGVGKHPIRQHRPKPDYVQQSSEDIWRAIRAAVHGALVDAQVDGSDVSALSYSATCSLVLLDRDHQPLVLTEGDTPWDTVMWMDHRAWEETRACNASGSAVLRNLGGSMSVEMQIPKMMWIKRHRPDLWERLGYAGDLADFLGFRSTGSLDRSICTLACKWTYDPDAGGWNDQFLKDVGLADLRDRASLPDRASAIGACIGTLTTQAAEDLGLPEKCRVGVGLIDAHAGTLGTSGLSDVGIENRLALIAGTSNCHIALTREHREVPGVWGPYSGAVLDGWYALEGGQSATGAALDQILRMFQVPEDCTHDTLGAAYLEGLAADSEYASDICVLPDFLGNRAPFADPNMRGAILGLSLDDPEILLPKIYGATALGIAFGTRQILESMRQRGLPLNSIYLSGGHVQSELLVRLYADATGYDLHLPGCEEPVLLGAACAAAATHPDFHQFRQKAQANGGRVIEPDTRSFAVLEKRYQAFTRQYSIRSSFKE